MTTTLLWQNEFASLAHSKRAGPTTPPTMDLVVKKPKPTWDELTELMEAIRVFYAKADEQKRQVCLLFDIRELSLLPPAMIVDFTKLFQGLRAVTERIVLCSAVVIHNPHTRAALDALLALYTTAKPLFVCSSVDEARGKFCTVN